MKIVIDLTPLDDHFSGIERYAASLAAELIRNQENAFVLVFKNRIPAMFGSAVKQSNVQAMVVRGKNRLLFNQLKLPAALAAVRADMFLFLAFPEPVLMMKRNVLTAIHDIGCWDCPETMKRLSCLYFRISYRAALIKRRRILTVSEFTRRRLVERLKAKEERIALVRDGVNEKFLKYERDPSKESEVRARCGLPERYILSLSTLEPRKNLHLLVRAYRNLIVCGEICEDLVLVGRKGWKMETLLSGIEPEVQKRIHFTGFVEDCDLPSIYAMASLFVFPSRYEGFGLPPLEALSCGTPVLSSDAASLTEVLGGAVEYFESENLSALEAGMIRMLRMDEDALCRRRRAGRERAAMFRWDAEAEKLEMLLRKIGEGAK